MDYRELFKESNKEVEERFLLTRERIGEIAAGEKNGMKEQVHRYFKKTAQFLEKRWDNFNIHLNVGGKNIKFYHYEERK